MTILHFLTYIAIVLFLVMIIQRLLKIATAPRHLRWELYPVPHEKQRASYGGSRLEEVDWWTKYEKKDLLGEIRVMAAEIIFLKGVWEKNKELWLGSFPFHFGLYILIINLFFLIISGILQLSGVRVDIGGNGLGLVLYYVVYILAIAGSVIGFIGSVRLLFSRIANSDLALYSTTSHYFNIVLIGLIYFSLLFWTVSEGNFVEGLVGYYAGIISFSGFTQLPSIGYVHIVLVLFFMAYLPLTHMTHFFTKYFTYHRVRWEDEANLPGSKIKEQVSKYLNMPVTWAAPHIGADGKKNWIAIASYSAGGDSQETTKESSNGK